MKKDLNICLLLDYYGALLTEKQRRCLGFYYNEDLSLSEIAEIIGGTRQAAQELIRRAEGRLNQMEQQLQLVQRHNAQRRLVTAALAALKAGTAAEAANYLSQLENQL